MPSAPFTRSIGSTGKEGLDWDAVVVKVVEDFVIVLQEDGAGDGAQAC
jgi:hypothetical protein